MTLNHPQAQTEEQRYLLAVLGSNDGVWDWDFKTGKIFFSDRWKSMLGYLPEEIGDALQDWESRVHPDDLGWVTQAIQAHWAGESELFSVEHRLRHKGGHYLWVLGRGRSQFDDAGTPVRMTGTHVDVTERRATREAAKTLSDELQTILNLSPDGFVAFDRLGKVKCVTPAFETLTLLGARQVLGLTEDQFWDQMASVSKPKSKVGNVSTVRDNLGQADSLRRSLIELAVPEGRMLMVSEEPSAAGDASTIAKIMCFRDVSREIELDRLKTEFLSTAAHELRSPLASIFGFSELLIKEVDPARRTEFSEIVYKQAKAMNHLLDEMLDLARIEAGRQTDFVFTNVCAKDLVQGVLNGFALPEGRDSPVLEAPTGDLLVRVDVEKAGRVILNVLTNAFKYSPDGGPVKIRIERVPVNADDSEVVIHVCDRGIGMSQSEVAKVFDRFYRVSSRADIPGTGLGMSIVKEIMALLNGHVKIDSQPQTGTCVALCLPSA